MDFEAPVWRIRADGAAGLVAVECRDADRLQASYFVLEVDTGRLLVHGLQAEENWWTGLCAIHNKVLYLHSFADRQTGQPQGIQAFDAVSGELLWQNKSLRYLGLGNDVLVALPGTGPEPPKLVALDPLNGKILNASLDRQEAYEAMEVQGSLLAEQFEVPVQYREGDEYFNLLKDFIGQRLSATPVEAIDYLETADRIIVGYYFVITEGKMANHLAVFSRSGEFLAGEPLSKEMDEIGSEAFFRFRSKLFFIQDKYSLQSFVI